MVASDDRPLSDAEANASARNAVMRTVHQSEALMEWVPRVLFLLLWLLPIAFALGGGVANAIVVGIVMGLLTPLVNRAVAALLLAPMRALRYQQAARVLDGQLYLFGANFLVRHSWQEPSPGVLAVASDSDLILADPSTGYALERIPVSAIRDVTIDRHTTQVTRTRHGSRFTLNGGGTIFGAVSFGGRSRSVTRSIETFILELRYRHPNIGPMRTVLIGFGGDRRAADDLRIALLDLAVPAASKPDPRQESFLA